VVYRTSYTNIRFFLAYNACRFSFQLLLIMGRQLPLLISKLLHFHNVHFYFSLLKANRLSKNMSFHLDLPVFNDHSQLHHSHNFNFQIYFLHLKKSEHFQIKDFWLQHFTKMNGTQRAIWMRHQRKTAVWLILCHACSHGLKIQSYQIIKRDHIVYTLKRSSQTYR